MSPGHGASLSTTAGITSVITGVMAAALAGQVPPSGAPEGPLACAAIGALAVGAAGLYAGRNAVCRAMDEAQANMPTAGMWAARALAVYHLGMVGVFAGLAFAAAWRVALPHGALGWAGAAVAGAMALRAGGSAWGWAREMRRRQCFSPPPAGGVAAGRGGGPGGAQEIKDPSAVR